MTAEIQIANRTFGARYLVGLLIAIILIAGTIYGIYNYQKNKSTTKDPTVEIYKPTDNQEVSEPQIVVEGKTEAGNTVKVQSIETTVDAEGKFAATTPINEGKNIITTEVVSENGKSIMTERTVIRVIPQPIVTTESTSEQTSASSNIVGTTSSLNNSGPENFWLPEVSALAAAGTAWIAAKRRLSKAAKK